MSLIQILILSVVQGITEWLPISSSAHLLILAGVFGQTGPDELMINAMAHLGTLLALLLYFRRDIVIAIKGGFELIGIGRPPEGASPAAHLASMILAATPIALLLVFGYTLLPDALTAPLRSLWTVIFATIFFALLLWWADAKGSSVRTEAEMRLSDAILIGATQAIAAIIPGTSRSGITMTTARALGFSRIEAARFAMLIGAPLLAASGVYAFYQLLSAEPGTISLGLTDAGLIIAFSFVSAFVSIWGLMALLKRMSFLPFVIYRLALGVGLILASPIALGFLSA